MIGVDLAHMPNPLEGEDSVEIRNVLLNKPKIAFSAFVQAESGGIEIGITFLKLLHNTFHIQMLLNGVYVQKLDQSHVH